MPSKSPQAVEIRSPLPGDAEHVALHMRAADVAEAAACGYAPFAALELSMRYSTIKHTATLAGEPVLLFGVVPVSILGGEGSPWLLGTDRITENPGVFIRESAPYIGKMLTAFPTLRNFVDQRNVKSVKWLRRCGFTIHPAIPYGVNGEPFHPFDLRV